MLRPLCWSGLSSAALTSYLTLDALPGSKVKGEQKKRKEVMELLQEEKRKEELRLKEMQSNALAWQNQAITVRRFSAWATVLEL